MDRPEYLQARVAIYALCDGVFANQERKRQVLRMALYRLENEGGDNKEIILQMVNLFHDGLAYGNWPWIKNGVDTLAQAK